MMWEKLKSLALINIQKSQCSIFVNLEKIGSAAEDQIAKTNIQKLKFESNDELGKVMS